MESVVKPPECFLPQPSSTSLYFLSCVYEYESLDAGHDVLLVFNHVFRGLTTRTTPMNTGYSSV